MIYNLSNKLDVSRFNAKVNQLILSDKTVELTDKRKKRTIKQNSYLHVAITLFAIEVGYTIEEAKTALKRECTWMYYEKNNIMFLKRTRDLNTKELTDFIDFIIVFCGKQGIYIPSSEEYIINQFDIDRQINNQKQYL